MRRTILSPAPVWCRRRIGRRNGGGSAFCFGFRAAMDEGQRLAASTGADRQEPGQADGMVDARPRDALRPPPSATTARPMSRVAMPRRHSRIAAPAPAARPGPAADMPRCARRNRRARRAPRPCGRRSPPRVPLVQRFVGAQQRLPGWIRRWPADCSISAASASVTSSSRLSRDAAGQEIDGVGDLDGIAGGRGERLVHVGDQRRGLQAGAVGDLDQAGRQRAGVARSAP